MTENLQMIREHIADLFVPDKHKRGFYQCPLCPSGHGGAGSDGALSIEPDGIHAKCFSCGFYGDIFDWEAEITKKPLSEATRAVIARYDFSPSTGSQKPAAPAADPAPAAAPADFTAKLRLCADKLAGSPGEKYLIGRGFTQETMRRFMLGYNAEKNEITIPYNRACSYYSTRRMAPDADPKHWKPKKEDADTVLFNAAALRGDQPCFVVESPLCAISIMQEGGSAVALAGATNQNLLLQELAQIKNPALLILSLDNDPVGKEQQEKLAAKLTEAGINFVDDYNVSGNCKDPNELLQKDPALLRGFVAGACDAAEKYAAELKQKALSAYEETSTAGTFDGFLAYLNRNESRNPIPTGFTSLDKILNGGLVPGLYIMGAVSSLGKTALMVNFADNIAAAGTDVLYFSLEMSKYELMARSISRLSFSLAGKKKSNTDEAFTTFGVLFGAKHIEEPGSLLPDAMKIYRETIGPHIWYFEGVGSITVDEIKQAVQQHIAKTGRKPVVFIDYLQIISAPDPRATDKHNTDVIVTTLKQLSRDEDVPVFCISSLNRMNYNEPVNMAAFKESGAIEYGSDVLIGLQLYGLGWEGTEGKEKHKARIQKLIEKAEKDDRISIQVRVLKNRNGRRGDSGELQFTKRFNSFFEVPEDFKVVYSDENPFADDDEKDEDGWTVVKKD
jgi:replicative DNA helicase